MAGSDPKAPRNFFLNERHELGPLEKDSKRASAPKLGPINWSQKAATLSAGFARARTVASASKDPGTRDRFFLAASPASIPKYTERKGKRQDFNEQVDFRNARSTDLARLGFDLLSIADDGRALVHAPAARFTTLEQTASHLSEEQERARNRWLAIESLGTPDRSWRIDNDWLNGVGEQESDCIVELMPVLTRVEAEAVVTAIQLARPSAVPIIAWGTDYSGRAWLRTRVKRPIVEWIADEFPSIQLLHPPYGTSVANSDTVSHPIDWEPTFAAPPSISTLPLVGLVDFGVSETHPRLAPYRSGRWRSASAVPPNWAPQHGPQVATRIVFGKVSRHSTTPLRGDCAFLDIATGVTDTHVPRIDDKDVVTSMRAALGTSGALRTFVCAFDTIPVQQLDKAEREEKLRQVREMDNFIVENDVVVVVSAGNVPKETVPNEAYPEHVDDPNWQLGPWASAHNTLTCGGYVEGLGESDIVRIPEAPSSFTRVGPGFAGAGGVPDAAAHAGGELGGALVMDNRGGWKSSMGTSYAAPLLAREAAKAFVALEAHCPDESRVSSALVKAYLALTATPLGKHLPSGYKTLVKRALGDGLASADRLVRPNRQTALFLWQGVVDGPDDIVRVLLPVPRTWLDATVSPRLRVVTAWNSYVNDTATALWSCRRVDVQLRVGRGKDEAIRPGAEHLGATYPRSTRNYDLGKAETRDKIQHDELVLSVSYKTEGMAPMLGFVRSRPEQVVGIAAELFDADGVVSPFDDVVGIEQTIGVMDRLRAAMVPLTVRPGSGR